jgi:hypothetical protein
MTELLHGEISKVQVLVQAGVALMALIMIVVVWAKSKAFVPTLGAVLFGALVVWAVNNAEFLEQKVGEEFETGAATAEAITDDARVDGA